MWVEQAGARAVAVPYNATYAETETLFASLNGALFPGCAVPIGSSARAIYELAEASNAAGQHFPI
jgi:hypothetical protein